MARTKHEKTRRKEIAARLRARPKENPSGSALLKNTSSRPYVRLEKKLVSLDLEALRRQQRYDGKDVLRSHWKLTPQDIYRAYRQLARVGQVFQTAKGPPAPPVRHFSDRRIRGRIAVSFVAYALEMTHRQAMGWGEGFLPGDLADEHTFAGTMHDLRRVTSSTDTHESRRPS